MSDVFDRREKYFSDQQLRHINEFMGVCPDSKTIVKNAKGDKRTVRSVSLPTGTISLKTWRFHGRDQDPKERPHKYHTPGAILSQRTAIISFEDMNTGEKTQCDSVDWLKWLGGKYTVEPAKSSKITVPDAFDKQMDAEAVKAKREHEKKEKDKTKKGMAEPSGNGDGKPGKKAG